LRCGVKRRIALRAYDGGDRGLEVLRAGADVDSRRKRVLEAVLLPRCCVRRARRERETERRAEQRAHSHEEETPAQQKVTGCSAVTSPVTPPIGVQVPGA
jgi:hypothetical protein